jgi:hypothetical protein
MVAQVLGVILVVWVVQELMAVWVVQEQSLILIQASVAALLQAAAAAVEMVIPLLLIMVEAVHQVKSLFIGSKIFIFIFFQRSVSPSPRCIFLFYHSKKEFFQTASSY